MTIQFNGKRKQHGKRGLRNCSQSEVAGETFLYNLVKILDAVQPVAQSKVADQRLGGVVGGVQQPVDHLCLRWADDGKVEPDRPVLRDRGGLEEEPVSPYFCQDPSSSSPLH